jgi:hypothetical protein
MYRSVFAFGGADQRILDVLFNSEYSDRLIVEGNTSALWREEPNGPNYLLTSTQKITEHINSKGVSNTRQNLDGMRFELDPRRGQERTRYLCATLLALCALGLRSYHRRLSALCGYTGRF